MKVLAITWVISFVISLPLRWWQNTWIGASDWDTPPIVRAPVNQRFFLAFTLILTCAGIIGFWYFFGFWIALLAFSAHWWAGRTSWNRTFQSEVDRAADHYYRQMLRAKANGGKPKEMGLSPMLPENISTWEDDDMKREAHRLGQITAREMRLERH